MINIYILKVFLLIFTVFFNIKTYAAELIMPLPKPKVDNEIKTIVEKKKNIYPQKKPTKEKSTKLDEPEIEQIEKTTSEVFIYPKKKPFIVKKKTTKIVSKSNILSKKDFNIAKKTFKEIEKRKWLSALKLSKKSKDNLLIYVKFYL